MRKLLFEIIAAVLVISTLILVPILLDANGPWNNKEGMRVIHLTALSEGGIWTDEEVSSLNYGYKEFRKANPILRVGEKIILRLSSADVVHTFYVPELNIGPIEVNAGEVKEIILEPDSVGNFIYYCTTVCGDCHFYMQGTLTVLGPGEEFGLEKDFVLNDDCDTHDLHTKSSSFIEFGKSLFEEKGCVTCHGENGIGGINNPNYVNKNVPELNTLADKLKIYWEDDAKVIIDLLENNTDLYKLEDDPPIKRFNRFLAQYESIINKINDGALDLQKLKPDGPTPPLFMPSWEHHLDERERDAIIAYLIEQYPWESYE